MNRFLTSFIGKSRAYHVQWLLLIGMLMGLCFCAGTQNGRGQQQDQQEQKKQESQKQDGRDAFVSMCSKCHDEDAEGDGPHHWEYRPSPANLTLVRNSKSMVVSIIQSGIPGTGMPAFPAETPVIESIMKHVKSRPPDTNQEWTVPWELGNPRPDTMYGASLYATACLGCHGETGDGKGSWAQDARIWPKPANLHGRNSELGRLYYFISNGREGTMMPPQKDKLPARARWDLAGFVYTLFDKSSSARIQVPGKEKPPDMKNPFSPDDREVVDRGEDTYDLYCAYCHNAEGKGSFLAPKLIDREWRYSLGTDTDLFVLVEKGIPGRLMPAHKALEEDRRWAVITYLRHRGGRPDPWANIPGEGGKK